MSCDGLLQPLDRALPALVASYDSLYPAEEEKDKEVEDNCSLMYLNEATLLNNVRLRYSKVHFYKYPSDLNYFVETTFFCTALTCTYLHCRTRSTRMWPIS